MSFKEPQMKPCTLRGRPRSKRQRRGAVADINWKPRRSSMPRRTGAEAPKRKPEEVKLRRYSQAGICVTKDKPKGSRRSDQIKQSTIPSSGTESDSDKMSPEVSPLTNGQEVSTKSKPVDEFIILREGTGFGGDYLIRKVPVRRDTLKV